MKTSTHFLSEQLLRNYIKVVLLESEDEDFLLSKLNPAIEVAVNAIFKYPDISKEWMLQCSTTEGSDVLRHYEKRVSGLLPLNIMMLNAKTFEKDWTLEVLSLALKKYFRDNVNLKLQFSSALQRALEVLESAPEVIEKLRKKLDEDSEKLEKEGEAPPKAALGQIAFAPSREEVPYEANTQVETELLSRLKSHFIGHEYLGKESFEIIKKFLKNEWYSEVFKPAEVSVVYRGIGVNGDWLSKFLGANFPKKGSKDVSANVGGIKKHRVSSWTKNKSVAKEFSYASIEGDDGMYSVIMHARPSDNKDKMMDCDGLYQVKEFGGYDEEAEVFCFGPAKIFKIEWSMH